MQLTQKQESLISQYLRDASRRLDSTLPDTVRDRHLRQLQARIYRDLESIRTAAISDDDVMAVLGRVSGQISQPAAPATGGPAPAPVTRAQGQPGPKPVWLGVCAYNAERFGLEPWTVRLAAVVLGALTGPVSLFCYVAAYVEYYLSLETKARPPISGGLLALRSIVPLAALILLRWGGGKVEALIAYAHERLVHAPLPPLGDWDWLQYYNASLFYLACLSVIPLGILSGLPMANAWGHSLKRLAQALVALYAVTICFGLASVLVGIILDRVEVYLQ